MAIVEFELSKLEEASSEDSQMRRVPPQLTEDSRGVFTAARAEFASRQIPLGQRAPWLDRIVGPPSELLVRRRSLSAIELIELLEDRGKFGVGRMMLHEIFHGIVPHFRLFQSQTRLAHRAQSRDQNRAARALRPSQDRLEKLKGPLAVA